MRALIVDDEPLARDVLRFYLEDEADVVVIGECEDGPQAVRAIHHEAPDLVFLDVQMPGSSGLDVVRQVEAELPAIVFVTAFDRYAVEAFELHALDYLLKPVEETRFRDALSRVRQRLGARDLQRHADQLRNMLASFDGSPTGAQEPLPQGSAELSSGTDRLLVRGRNKISVVRLQDLDWVESAGDYVYLHCGSEKHLLRQPMGQLEAQLAGRRFRRIHRSTLVNLDRIDEIRFADHGELRVRLLDGTLLKVSRTYRKTLADFLDEA